MLSPLSGAAGMLTGMSHGDPALDIDGRMSEPSNCSSRRTTLENTYTWLVGVENVCLLSIEFESIPNHP